METVGSPGSKPLFLMARFLLLCLLALLLVSGARAGDANVHQPGFRSTLLAAVTAEFVRVRPCGIAGGPTYYRVDHLVREAEWACIAGSARYRCHTTGAFEVKFIALLKWKCGVWQVSSISFDADQVTRRQFVGYRQVPPAILPNWIRWSP